MASKQTSKKNTADHSKNTFAETMHFIARRFSLFTVFDDFLSIAMAACTQNLQTKSPGMKRNILNQFQSIKIQSFVMNFQKHLHI
jgi:hypothetical protein